MSDINTVIFDIGGVIVKPSISGHEGYFAYLAKISHKNVRRVRFVIDTLTPRFEKGRMTLAEFTKKVASRLDITREAVRWMGFYKEHISVDTDITDLVEHLHSEYTTAYLSNIDRPKYLYTKRILASIPFDYQFASCNMGVRKPEIEIFTRVLSEIGITPRNAVFIDNQLENVLMARKVGMLAVHFKNRRKLDISLARLLKE